MVRNLALQCLEPQLHIIMSLSSRQVTELNVAVRQGCVVPALFVSRNCLQINVCDNAHRCNSTFVHSHAAARLRSYFSEADIYGCAHEGDQKGSRHET